MGFYAPAQLVRNASEHGVEVRPIDVNLAAGIARWRADAIRLGLRMIVGLPQSQALLIEAARGEGRFNRWTISAAAAGFVRRWSNGWREPMRLGRCT